MITKAPGRRRKSSSRMDVNLTVRFRFGDAPADHITMLDDRAVPMVNSVFENRDRIMRAFFKLMLEGSLKSPAVIREIVPLNLMRSRKG